MRPSTWALEVASWNQIGDWLRQLSVLQCGLNCQVFTDSSTH